MKGFSQMLFLGILATSMAGLFASGPCSGCSWHNIGNNLSVDIGSYAEKVPGIGLISDGIRFDGITIEDFHFSNDKKFIFVKPGEKVPVFFNYAVDSSELKSLYLHHLIIGLHDDGPQACVLHSLGILDSKGKATLNLKAPERVGAYQVRFCHSVGLTDEQAQKAWWRGEGTSAKTIVAILIVK